MKLLYLMFFVFLLFGCVAGRRLQKNARYILEDDKALSISFHDNGRFTEHNEYVGFPILGYWSTDDDSLRCKVSRQEDNKHMKIDCEACLSVGTGAFKFYVFYEDSTHCEGSALIHRVERSFETEIVNSQVTIDSSQDVSRIAFFPDEGGLYLLELGELSASVCSVYFRRNQSYGPLTRSFKVKRKKLVDDEGFKWSLSEGGELSE